MTQMLTFVHFGMRDRAATATFNQLKAHRPVLKDITATIRKNKRKNDPTVSNKSHFTEPEFSATCACTQLH